MANKVVGIGSVGRARRRDDFVRQLRDIEISIRVETFGRWEMGIYAAWSGRALALSRARGASSHGCNSPV